MSDIEEVIVWHDISNPPSPKINKGPLLVKRRGPFPLGVWWRQSDINDMGAKYYYWSIGPDIRYWAEINGPRIEK